jgi:hypothetical protein
MAREGQPTLTAVTGTVEGTPIQSGRRQWLSWSYEPDGVVTGGVNLQLQVRITSTGIWFDVGDVQTDVNGKFVIGNVPIPVYDARVNQTGAITGGGSITANIMYG